MFKIAVLVSGGGSNLQSIIDSINDGKLNCKIEMVISDRALPLVVAQEQFDLLALVAVLRELPRSISRVEACPTLA